VLNLRVVFAENAVGFRIMFRFTLFVVGRLKNKALAQLCDDFTKRLARRGSLQIVEFKDGSLRSESDRLRTALAAKQDHEVFVLAEEGCAYSSHEFAEKLQLHHGKPLLFIIGGAYGMEPALKQMGHHLIALSPLTFTHEMARFLLLEQLYRAVSIVQGGQYHHE
jgi:23S rRNA (pseudouridine1915-N3)-methyltransferase